MLKKTPRKFHKWSKSDWSSMRTDTKSWVNEWLKSSVTRTTQENYTSFCKHIQSLISKYVSDGFTKTKKYIPWLTPDLKRRLPVEGNAGCIIEQRSPRHHITGSLTNVARLNAKKLRRSHWQHLNNILLTSETEKNPKPFWVT